MYVRSVRKGCTYMYRRCVRTVYVRCVRALCSLCTFAVFVRVYVRIRQCALSHALGVPSVCARCFARCALGVYLHRRRHTTHTIDRARSRSHTHRATYAPSNVRTSDTCTRCCHPSSCAVPSLGVLVILRVRYLYRARCAPIRAD